MKPAPFDYHRPDSREEVLELLSAGAEDSFDEVKVLAGGQSLIPAMNFRLARPARLIDLQCLSDLQGIEALPGGLRIGAMTRQRTIELSADVACRTPLLHETVPFIAHPQIRNRGTIGGTLAHADPAAELPAVMLALDAQIHVQGVEDLRQKRTRAIAADEFFLGLFETALQPHELLVAVEFSAPAAGEGSAFSEVSRRSGDYALCGCAARLRLAEDGTCVLARLAFLSVADQAVRAVNAERAIVGENLLAPAASDVLASAAAQAAAREIEPGSDLHASAAFRRHLAEGLAEKTLNRALVRARSTLEC